MLETVESVCPSEPAEKDERLERLARSLYVRLPATIRDRHEVETLMDEGKYTVKLPRRSGRHCTVIFETLEEKARQFKALKGKVVDGKQIVVRDASAHVKKRTPKKPHKKVKVPKVEPDAAVTRTLFITCIKCGVTTQEVQEALPGCKSVKLLKAHNKDFRSAIVKMENLQIAREYLMKKREWPVIHGVEIKVHSDKRSKRKKKKKVQKDA